MHPKLSRVDEQMLVELYDKGPMLTSELKKSLGFEKNQYVNYRGKRKLGPGRDNDDLALGWVENRNEGIGSSGELTWDLTEEGREYVGDRRGQLEAPKTADEAYYVSRKAIQTVAKLDKRLSTVEGKIGSIEQKIEQLEGRSNSDTIVTTAETGEEQNENTGRLEQRIKQLEDILLEPERDRPEEDSESTSILDIEEDPEDEVTKLELWDELDSE